MTHSQHLPGRAAENGTTVRLHCDVREDGPTRWGVRFQEKEIPLADAVAAAQVVIQARKS